MSFAKFHNRFFSNVRMKEIVTYTFVSNSRRYARAILFSHLCRRHVKVTWSYNLSKVTQHPFLGMPKDWRTMSVKSCQCNLSINMRYCVISLDISNVKTHHLRVEIHWCAVKHTSTKSAVAFLRCSRIKLPSGMLCRILARSSNIECTLLYIRDATPDCIFKGVQQIFISARWKPFKKIDKNFVAIKHKLRRLKNISAKRQIKGSRIKCPSTIYVCILDEIKSKKTHTHKCILYYLIVKFI